MRILIFGAGAMGTSLGVLVTRAGEECELVSRNAAHIRALSLQGALLEEGSAHTLTKVNALLPDEMRGQYDVIFLCTKQRENADIAAFLLPFLKEEGALVTVQNGLPEAGVAEIFGASRVYGAVLSWGAERVGEGKVRITSDCGYPVALGAFGEGKRAEELAEILKRGGAEVTLGELKEFRFAKLVANGALSTLSAISGLTFGELAKKYKKLCLALLREIMAVARAAGCKALPYHGHDLFRVFGAFGRIALPIATKRYKSSRSGMLLDLEAGRRCDIDFVAGAAVCEGKKYGVSTEKLERAVSLVHDIENGLAELAPESLALI